MENMSNRTTKMEDDYLKMAMQATARAFDVDSEDILGRRRTEPLVFARQTAYWLIHSGLGLTYSKIGRMFHRDHGNIIHGVRKVRDVLELDLTSRNNNGSWADKARESRELFKRFHETYVESDVHLALKEATNVVHPS